jgi:hypothetical protein
MLFEIPDALPVLTRGNHKPDTGKACIMDAISIISGKPEETDHPSCVDPMLRSLFIRVNDSVTDDQRHRLWPLGLRAMGTATASQGWESVDDRHTAVSVLLTLARTELNRDGSTSVRDHPAGRVVPYLLAWMKNPGYETRRTLRFTLADQTRPERLHINDCQGCTYLNAASRCAALQTDIGRGLQVVEVVLYATPSADGKFRLLEQVMDAFERARQKTATPAPAMVPTVVDWDKLRAELGTVTAAP